ncbi:hypothetical protein, partial [Escherichia coli]|uniref:hypothetical protein n=2 Tax=Escherichia coli TaxID=562 RepID=UPI00388ECCC2
TEKKDIFASHNPLLNAEETRELLMMRRRNDEQIVHIKSFSRPKIHSNDEDLQEYGINPNAFFKIN